MITADSTFYQMEYRGGVESTIGDDFFRLGSQAKAYLYQVTMGRARANLSEDNQWAVNMAFCAVVDALLLNEQGGGVVSETNDGISQTYANGSNTVTNEERLYKACALYLGGTGLLYRGAGRC